MTTIWHNPRCSKSRQALTLLTDRSIKPVVRKYLLDAPNLAEIEVVLAKLDFPAADLVRFGEKVAKELGLSKATDQKILMAAMADHPILIERPIVINGDAAVLGRPPEAVLDIL